MIEKINQEIDVKIPHVYTMKGYVRFDGELKDGIFEITINSNYVIDRSVKTVKTIVKGEDKEIEPSDIQYENFDTNELGFLFYGENLTGNKPAIAALLKDIIRPVNNLKNFAKFLILKSLYKMKDKKKLFTKESITPEKLYEIEMANRGWGLGNDVYFDGKYFKDWDGNILPHHPRKKIKISFVNIILKINCQFRS